MKLKLMQLIAGALALTVAAAPLSVKAQPNQSSQAAPGQAQNRSQFGGLELTEQQKNQFAQIRRDTRAQIEKVLTQEQRKQFQSAIQSGKGRQTPFAAMNLSSEQQTQIQTIMQSAKSRAEAILTPQQRQQIQQYIQQRRQQR